MVASATPAQFQDLYMRIRTHDIVVNVQCACVYIYIYMYIYIYIHMCIQYACTYAMLHKHGRLRDARAVPGPALKHK